MINKKNAPGSAPTLHRGNKKKYYINNNRLSLAGQLQSRIKVLFLEMYCSGYLSERLTRVCFRLFRLGGA